jgi:hypothetical protein
MKGRGGSWKPAAIALALAALVVLAAPALAACGGGTSVTATPHASAGAGQAQPVERHGRLGDAIVLFDGAGGQVEATALGLKLMDNVATRGSTVSNVYDVKLRLRDVGSAPIHLADVAADSVMFDVGGWRYFPPGDNPKNALKEVDLGPGHCRVGWVYFAAPGALGAGAPMDIGAPNAYHYTARSSDVTAEGDTGQWEWTPIDS